MVKHIRAYLTALMLADMLLTAAAFGAACYLRFHSGLFPVLFVPSLDDTLILLVVAAPLSLILLTSFGAYEARRTESVFVDFPIIFDTGFILVLVLSAFIYFYGALNFSRLTVALFGIVFVLSFAGERILIRLTLKYLRSLGLNTKRLLIVGGGELARQVMQAVRNNPSYGYQVAGLLDDRRRNGFYKKAFGVDVLGRTGDIVEVVERENIDKVIIALPNRRLHKISQLVASCEHAGIEAEVAPDLFRFTKSRAPVVNLDGLPLLSVSSLPIKSWTHEVFKRGFDILLSLLLVLVLAPVIGLIALLIKLSSPGPVLFVQERIGTNGRRFNLIKFRTMLVNAEETLERKLEENDELRAEWENNFKLRDDPRITSIGAFLRRTSLDELPQLINVLRGEMSLVGPRPLPVYHQENLPEQVNLVRRRVRPGMTGLWQVSGRSDAGTEGMAIWDLYYVRNWSVWMDIVILLRTVPVVLRGTGAV